MEIMIIKLKEKCNKLIVKDMQQKILITE